MMQIITMSKVLIGSRGSIKRSTLKMSQARIYEGNTPSQHYSLYPPPPHTILPSCGFFLQGICELN